MQLDIPNDATKLLQKALSIKNFIDAEQAIKLGADAAYGNFLHKLVDENQQELLQLLINKREEEFLTKSTVDSKNAHRLPFSKT
jgi:hypothetical protein